MNFLRLFKKFKRGRLFSKRQEFVLATSILTFGLLLTQLVGFDQRFEMVGGLSILAFCLCAFALREDLKGIEWLTLLSLPTLFTLAVSLFYFLLPVRWLTRLPTVIFYALGIYALLLTENIFNVAAERSIQLLRVAQSVGFLITLVSIFLLFDTFFSFHLGSLSNFLAVFFISWPLFLQALWSVRLEAKLSRPIFFYSLFLSLCLAELAFVFSFWQVRPTIEALFLTTVFYSLAGVVQNYFLGRLFKKTVNEFILVLLVVFLLTFFTSGR